MKQKGLSQEGLKLIACVTMLTDHIGATLVLRYLQVSGDGNLIWVYDLLRLIGRIAFPIYCFLLVEGASRTRNPGKYAQRLFMGVLLSEIPFDMAFSFTGSVPDWTMNSVMLTLLLGFGMLRCMARTQGVRKWVCIVPFYILAELLQTDYAGLGILIIAIFALTKGHPHEKLLQAAALLLVIYPGGRQYMFDLWMNPEWFAVLALIPIFCYGGRKLTDSKRVQWGFYLFYPVHLLVLAVLERLLFG